MKDVGKLIVKANELGSRITSVSILGVGIGIKPTPTQRSIVRTLLIKLADKRVLFNDYTYEDTRHVMISIDDIRSLLTEAMSGLADETVGYKLCLQMRAECRRFLDESPREVRTADAHTSMNWYWEKFYGQLGAFRSVFGQHIALLAYNYGVDVEGSLVKILPPELEQGERPRREPRLRNK